VPARATRPSVDANAREQSAREKKSHQAQEQDRGPEPTRRVSVVWLIATGESDGVQIQASRPAAAARMAAAGQRRSGFGGRFEKNTSGHPWPVTLPQEGPGGRADAYRCSEEVPLVRLVQLTCHGRQGAEVQAVEAGRGPGCGRAQASSPVITVTASESPRTSGSDSAGTSTTDRERGTGTRGSRGGARASRSARTVGRR